ncbi:hypothetical protein [Myxococcus faecalis]
MPPTYESVKVGVWMATLGGPSCTTTASKPTRRSSPPWSMA